MGHLRVKKKVLRERRQSGQTAPRGVSISRWQIHRNGAENAPNLSYAIGAFLDMERICWGVPSDPEYTYSKLRYYISPPNTTEKSVTMPPNVTQSAFWPSMKQDQFLIDSRTKLMPIDSEVWAGLVNARLTKRSHHKQVPNQVVEFRQRSSPCENFFEQNLREQGSYETKTVQPV